MKKGILSAFTFGLALLVAASCATPRLIPVRLPGAMVSPDNRSLCVEKEGIALEVMQGRNPSGAGSDLVTFQLVVRNTTDKELEFLLHRAVLLDGLGTQYESIRVHELSVRGYVWEAGGWYYDYPWGWYGVSYPVTVTESARLQDRNFPASPLVILSHSQVHGCLFFPCRIKDTTYVRLILTRLIKEKEEPGSRPNTVRTTYRKVKYEYEFDVAH